MKFDSAFYQFATGIVAMLCLLAVSLFGKGDNEYIVSAFSMVMGGGLWGGMQHRLMQKGNENARARRASKTANVP